MRIVAVDCHCCCSSVGLFIASMLLVPSFLLKVGAFVVVGVDQQHQPRLLQQRRTLPVRHHRPSSSPLVVRHQSNVNYLDSLSSPHNSATDTTSTFMDSPSLSVPPPPPPSASTAISDSTSATAAPPSFVPGNGYTPPAFLTEAKLPTSESPSSISPVTTTSIADDIDVVVFHHAPLSYFHVSKLAPKGPRKGADVGTPHDATRPLLLKDGVSAVSGVQGTIRAGSWWCAAGGWPSPNERTTTEIFYVLSGYGCLTDLDGVRHYFGPGDVCILPKGWSGRWDIAEDLHKLWFVHDHEKVEVTDDDPIRITVKHYHELVSSQYMTNPPQEVPNALYDTRPSLALHTLFDVGPTEVSSATLTPGSFFIAPQPTTQCFAVLEGVFVLTNDNNSSDEEDDNHSTKGTAQRCGPGDLVVLPKGWSGYWDVLQTVKKVWVVV